MLVSNEFEPYIDTVWLGLNMPRSLAPVSKIDMHLFSYFACVISLLGGRPINNWMYRYTITDDGFPYSADLDDAIDMSIKNGLFKIKPDNTLAFQRNALEAELDLITNIRSSISDRFEFLRTSLRASLLLPIGKIRNSISVTDSSKNIYQTLNQGRFVFEDESEISSIYAEYESVLDAFEDHNHGALSPLIVWISTRLIEVQEDAGL